MSIREQFEKAAAQTNFLAGYLKALDDILDPAPPKDEPAANGEDTSDDALR